MAPGFDQAALVPVPENAINALAGAHSEMGEIVLAHLDIDEYAPH